MSKTGVLYGVGLGPGDPGLVTRKAWALIEQARVVAYPAPEGGASFARSIAAEAISPEAEEIAIAVPMRTERFPAQAAYDQAATQIAARLAAGLDVVTLCEGDPFFYGSFMYLFDRLAGDFEVSVVPGVTSLTACAGMLGRPLVSRNDGLAVIPGTAPTSQIRDWIQAAEAAAILKVGKRLASLRALITELGLLDQSGYVAHASLPQAQAMPLKDAPADAPYFSMILIYKGAEPWTLDALNPSS